MHNAWTVTAGNKADHYKARDVLGRVDDILVSVYAAKTGLKPGRLVDMLAAETWLTADECYDLEFCDSVGAASLVPYARFDARRFRNVPQRVLTGKDSYADDLRREVERRRKAAGLD